VKRSLNNRICPPKSSHATALVVVLIVFSSRVLRLGIEDRRLNRRYKRDYTNISVRADLDIHIGKRRPAESVG